MNAMRNITIIYPALCEKIITFRLTFLLPGILSLRFFEPQQERLRVLPLLQIGLVPSKSGTIMLKPYPVQREKTAKVN